MSANNSLRLLHTSDLHMETIGDSACQSMETLLVLAKKLKIDLVLVAGDLFDHNRVDDDLVELAIQQLSDLAVPVVILPGNHDCLSEDSVFDRTVLWSNCSRLQVIREPSGETIKFPKLGISVWGKPITSYCGDIRPLAGMPAPEAGWWNIVVAHGTIEDEQHRTDSYRISLEEISNSRRDYVALGHWPNFKCVSDSPVKAYYSDSLSWSFPESTVNLIELRNGQGAEVIACPLINNGSLY